MLSANEVPWPRPSVSMSVRWTAVVKNTSCCLPCHRPLPSIDEQMTTTQHLDHRKLLLNDPTRFCAIDLPVAGRIFASGCQQSCCLIPKHCILQLSATGTSASLVQTTVSIKDVPTSLWHPCRQADQSGHATAFVTCTH